MKKINLGIIGCGMATEVIHLPVLSKCKNVNVTSIIDIDSKRVYDLGQQYDIHNTGTDYNSFLHMMEAAIIAVPHHMHAAIALDLMEKGLHVLVEKPIALRGIDCKNMIEVSKKNDVVLYGGHVRRLYEPIQKVKKLIAKKNLGEVIRFEMLEGRIFEWPAITFDMFDPNRGGGVLTDIGSHVLDLMLWWFGDIDSFEYFDDARGGVEANCEISFKMKSGAVGRVELSRVRDLRNTYKVLFEKGTIEVTLGHDALVKIERPDNYFRAYLDYSKKNKRTIMDYFHMQMMNFVKAMQGKISVDKAAEECMCVVELIEMCKQNRKQLEYPWEKGGKIELYAS